jgi:ribonuclease HII
MAGIIVCGLDECGRGPLAGPIVAAGVIFTRPIKNLKDSKKLSPQKRQYLYGQILKHAVVEIEIISVRQINSRGIGWANKEVFKRLIKKLQADKYIVDGNLKIKKATSLIKADDKIPEVMAASIIAKVTRDQLMKQLHDEHPHYGWSSNMGYGTRQHVKALHEYGPCSHHRHLFVNTVLKKSKIKV